MENKLFAPTIAGYFVPYYPGAEKAIEKNKRRRAIFKHNHKEVDIVKHKPKKAKYPQYYIVFGNEIYLCVWNELIRNTKKNKIRLKKIQDMKQKIEELQEQINSEYKKMSYLERK